MKKVTAFIGTASKRHTLSAVREFLGMLEKLGGVESEIVVLSDYDIGTCIGCKLCMDKGEELCPLKDDRDLLIDKIMQSDGVIFATPNYAFQVSGMMKVFLDRISFIFHRPRFHKKAFTSIVVQGVYRGRQIVKYLGFVGGGLGFNVVKGTCSTAFEPMTEKEKKKRDQALKKQSIRFHKQLARSADHVPSMIELFMFRTSRTRIKLMLDEDYRDYTYYKEQGWFESGYYYPVNLGSMKKAAGRLFDWVGSRMAKTRND